MTSRKRRPSATLSPVASNTTPTPFSPHVRPAKSPKRVKLTKSVVNAAEITTDASSVPSDQFLQSTRSQSEISGVGVTKDDVTNPWEILGGTPDYRPYASKICAGNLKCKSFASKHKRTFDNLNEQNVASENERTTSRAGAELSSSNINDRSKIRKLNKSEDEKELLEALNQEELKELEGQENDVEMVKMRKRKREGENGNESEIEEEDAEKEGLAEVDGETGPEKKKKKFTMQDLEELEKAVTAEQERSKKFEHDLRLKLKIG